MFNTKQILLIVILACLSVVSLANENRKFRFISDQGAKQQDTLQQISLRLSPEVQEAINSGIEVSIISHYAKARKILFWHHYKKLQSVKFQLRRHTLSNRYMVIHPELRTPKVFRSITEAMQYISFFSINLLESLQQDSDKVAVRIHLNKFDLPGSLRPKSFLSSDWTHNTGWKIWTKSI